MAKMDANFFKPFVDGTLNTIKTSCDTEAKVQKPFLRGTQPEKKFDIAGVIALTSTGFTGSITICFPKAVFLTLMGKMLGETYTDITPDLQDGAAEMLNMIFGQAKVVLNQQGHTIQKAIPTVIQGDGLQTAHQKSTPVMVLPFLTESGEFQIEICAEESI